MFSIPHPPLVEAYQLGIMAEENSAKIIPSSNIEPTIHPYFPTDKTSYIDHSIDNIAPCIIYPESSDINGGGPVEFIIHECAEHYLDLSSLRLEVKLRLLDGDGARGDGIAANEVCFVNNLLSSLFPIVKVFINNSVVECQYYAHHISRLNHLMDIPNELATNRGLGVGLFPIESAHIARVHTQGIAYRIATRTAFTKQNIIHLKGYLNTDIASSNKWLVDGTSLRVVLEPARANCLLNAINNDIPWQVDISSIKLHADRIRPSKVFFLSTSRWLQNRSMEYIHKRHIVHTEVMSAGQSSLTISRPFQNRIPYKFHLFMIDQAAEQGVFTQDRYFYNHNNLSNYRVMINGQLLTEADVVAADGYHTTYFDSLTAHGAEDYFIPSDMYTNGGFVLTVKTNTSQPNELFYESKGNMDIHLRFANNIANTQIVFIIGVIHTSYEITPDRNCITNFAY